MHLLTLTYEDLDITTISLDTWFKNVWKLPPLYDPTLTSETKASERAWSDSINFSEEMHKLLAEEVIEQTFYRNVTREELR